MNNELIWMQFQSDSTEDEEYERNQRHFTNTKKKKKKVVVQLKAICLTTYRNM